MKNKIHFHTQCRKMNKEDKKKKKKSVRVMVVVMISHVHTLEVSFMEISTQVNYIKKKKKIIKDKDGDNFVLKRKYYGSKLHEKHSYPFSLSFFIDEAFKKSQENLHMTVSLHS